MDGQQQQGKPAADVERQVQLIKARMPQTYRSIQAKAQQIGRPAFGLVRRALAGEPGLFWAMEAGHVVGTPFRDAEITAAVAQCMVAFGVQHVVIWAQSTTGQADGAH